MARKTTNPQKKRRGRRVLQLVVFFIGSVCLYWYYHYLSSTHALFLTTAAEASSARQAAPAPPPASDTGATTSRPTFPQLITHPRHPKPDTEKTTGARNERSEGVNRIRCETTAGPFEVQLTPELAPVGVKHLLTLVNLKFFDVAGAHGVPFFRVNEWITQFGAYKTHGVVNDRFKNLHDRQELDSNPYGGRNDDEASEKTRKAHSWKRGTIAMIGGTQMVIVRKQNAQMGTEKHDAPAGMVVKGMEEVIDKLYAGYGNAVDDEGRGPDQVMVMQEGMDYIRRDFPRTDYITNCTQL